MLRKKLKIAVVVFLCFALLTVAFGLAIATSKNPENRVKLEVISGDPEALSEFQIDVNFTHYVFDWERNGTDDDNIKIMCEESNSIWYDNTIKSSFEYELEERDEMYLDEVMYSFELDFPQRYEEGVHTVKSEDLSIDLRVSNASGAGMVYVIEDYVTAEPGDEFIYIYEKQKYGGYEWIPDVDISRCAEVKAQPGTGIMDVYLEAEWNPRYVDYAYNAFDNPEYNEIMQQSRSALDFELTTQKGIYEISGTEITCVDLWEKPEDHELMSWYYNSESRTAAYFTKDDAVITCYYKNCATKESFEKVVIDETEAYKKGEISIPDFAYEGSVWCNDEVVVVSAWFSEPPYYEHLIVVDVKTGEIVSYYKLEDVLPYDRFLQYSNGNLCVCSVYDIGYSIGELQEIPVVNIWIFDEEKMVFEGRFRFDTEYKAYMDRYYENQQEVSKVAVRRYEDDWQIGVDIKISEND